MTLLAHNNFTPVLLESPYAGEVKANERYARKAMLDCLQRNEAPYASHLLYTQPGVLDDTEPHQREAGISAGQAWLSHASYVVVYVNRGISPGMEVGITLAHKRNIRVRYRVFLTSTMHPLECAAEVELYENTAGLLHAVVEAPIMVLPGRGKTYKDALEDLVKGNKGKIKRC